MLDTLLRYLRNWFDVGRQFGEFSIQGGSLVLPSLQNGQYFRIIGSVFNDGVHQYPVDTLTDETFDGAVWALAIPKAVLDIAAEIDEWNTKNGVAATGPYQSESFGGYSYTLAKDADTGGTATWETAFRSRLSQWRKI